MLTGNQGTTLLDAVRVWPTPRVEPGNVSKVGDRVYETSLQSMARKGLMMQGWTPASGHWPTPDAAVSNDGEEPETFLARKAHHATKTDTEPTRAGVPLALAVKWATPRATEGEKGGPNGRDGSGSLHLAAQVLWPTTTTQDAHNNGGPSQHKRNTPPLNTAVLSWPTPNASDDKGASTRTEGRERPPADDDLPTRIARSASGLVLNPVFVEALMGWPLGWTDPTCRAGGAVPFPPAPNGDWASYLAAHPGTEPAVAKGEPLRTDRLRACGNGVVPAQAAAAFCELFEALGIGEDDEKQVQVVQDAARGRQDDLRHLQEQVARGEGQGLRGDEPRHALPRRELRALQEVQHLGGLLAGRRGDVRGLRQAVVHLRGADAHAGCEADEVNTPAEAPSKGWRNRWR